MRRIPSITYNKKCDDGDVVAQSGLRVSPEIREEDFTQRPSGRKGGARGRHRVSVDQTDRDFS
jgi:hypothetical protein